MWAVRIVGILRKPDALSDVRGAPGQKTLR
jgi:hypothetical protein